MADSVPPDSLLGGAGPLQRWRIDLAWLGTNYVGWQVQPNGRSVQATVQEALSRVLGGRPVHVSATGRTDAGVHAMQQVCSFVTDVSRTPETILTGLGALLPSDISCLTAERVSMEFNPRRWTRGKCYRYRVLRRRARCPFRHDRVWHRWRPVDVPAMHAAAQLLVGRHDFSSFRATGCAALNPERRILAASVRPIDDEIHFEFQGHGFLRHQVRIMCGTLLEVGEGRREIGDIEGILAARKRTAAGRTAPACGLWLAWVRLGNGPHGGPSDFDGATDGAQGVAAPLVGR